MIFKTIFRKADRQKVSLHIFIAAMLAALTSCGVDRWPEYAEQTAQDVWIYDTMQENYLWYDELPSDKNLNYFTAASTFLSSIIYKAQDNSYSFIDTVLTTPLASYGMTYSLQRNTANDTAYYALVTRVYPDSPASDAGLKRGDWIMDVNGTVITKKNESKLLGTGDAIKLTIGKYTVTTTGEGDDATTKSEVVESGTTEMAAERPVEEDVIGDYSVITTPMGFRLGYLVYNRFEAGTTDDSDKYNNKLREISRYFAEEEIDFMVVDLRYNSGGSFADSQLLASLIAPAASVTNDVAYAKMTYNDKRSADNRTLTYSKELIGTGCNLDIRQGFIITGSGTSASVAGCFLNCLSPLQCWALVGSSLSCWGVATERFVSPDLPWAVNPVVCTVSNRDGETSAGGSFSPNFSVSETSDYSRYLPLGDPDEAMLHAIITALDGE